MALNHNPYETAQRTLSGITAFASPDFNVDLLNNDQYLETKTGDKRKPVVYGTTRLGGILVFQDLIGENKDYLLQVYTLCEGEITGVPAIYANGTDTTSSIFDATIQQIDGKKVKVHSWPIARTTVYTKAYQDLFDVLGTVSDNKQRLIYTQVSYGRTDYTSTPLTIAKLSPKWDDTFLGKASASVAVVYDLSAFTEEPRLEFKVNGIAVMNLKTGVKELSSNPVYCLYDYLTNERYGNDTDPSELDIQSFIDQAALCDQPINIKTGVNLLSNTSAKTTIQKSSSGVGGTVINIGPSRFQSRGRVNYYRGQIVNEGFNVVGLKATNSKAENTKTAIAFNQQIIADPAFQIKDPILLINTLSYKSGGWNSGGDYYNYAIIINAKGEYIAVIAYDGSDVDVTVELEVENKPTGNTVSEKRFSLNGIINQEDTKYKNVENILAEMNARLYDYNGKKRLKCFVPSTVVKTFDDTNIIGSIDYAFGDSETKYNGVQATYRDPNFGYKEQTVVTVDNTYNGGNSNSKNFKEMKLNFCDSYGRAHYLASMFLNKSKLQDSIKFTSTRAGIQYAVGDVIRVNDKKNNINRTYTIEDKTINNDFTVTFNCLIYDSEIFKVLQLNIPYEPTLPAIPAKKITISTFNAKQVAFDSVGTVDLSWVCDSTGSGLVDHYTIEYKASKDNGVKFEHLATVTGDSYRVNNLRTGDYTFRIRALNKLETLASDYVITQLNISANIVVLPAVIGLQAGFNGATFEASWADTRTKLFTNVSSPSSVGETYSRYISGYQVQVYKGTALRRTEIVSDPRYIYSLEKNIQDGISRDIKIIVKTVNQSSSVSTTSATVQAVNPQMPAPVNLLIKVNYDTFHLSTFKPIESDYAGTVVYASKTANFTPSASTLISNGSNTVSGSLETGTWYFKVAHYDVFDSLNLSYASATAVLTEVTLVDFDADGIIADIKKSIENEAATRAANDIKNSQDALAAVAKEATDRIAAVSTEASARSNAIAKEASDRATALSAEASARSAALLAEAAARGTAIKNESTERKTAESNLATRIDAISVAISDSNATVETEALARAEADKALASRIDSLVTTTNNNKANITSLSKTVTDNNSALSTKIDTVQATAAQQATAAESNAKTFATASVTTEKNARVAADSALTTQVNSVKATANKNTADITTVNTSLVTKETALSNRIDAVQSSVNGVDGKVQTEITTRSTADTALGKRIDSVSATANKNTADIKIVNTTLAEKDLAMASRVTSMETSLKADSASKANKALADAKVAAATDAKAKADAALAAAKTDASGKAATAESNAKLAAATDAAAKANKALADAKAYSDVKKKEAVAYSDTKYNQAVSLINTKDSAHASLITSLESNVNRISSNSEQQIQDDCVFNSRFTLKNKENRPTGWFATYGSASPTNIGYSSDVNNGAYLMSATTAGVGMCSTAFRVRDGVEYVIRIKVKAQVAKPNGFYFRINEYDAELPRGKVAVGQSTSEAVVQQNIRQITAFRDNQAIGTAWEEYTWTYKPTVTAQYASALVLNWEGMGKNNALYIDYISIEAVVSKDYTDAKYNQAVSLINTKDAAQAKSVTDMATSLKADSASKAATAEANAKVAAAADAKAKADAALAAAKTDATSKANSAESKAKVAAATDAATKANKALADAKAYSDANDVKVTAVTTAKFNEAVLLINTKDAAQASRVTSMETSLKADSATKAAKAEANAKVAAATDAKAKADAALAAAKADATSKANSAESKAKLAAATDAAAKANKALADAKAYADVKKNEAVAYSDTKYNQAVSLINTKDVAQAKVITSLESTLKTDSQNKANIARDAAIAELNNRSNLLQKYLPNWKLGAHPSSCGMGQNGETNENRFVMGDDPFGTKSVVWEMSTNSSANSDADGGISSAWFDCDSKKSYRYSVYVKRTIANGTTYLGAGQSGETLELNGVTQTNPYFWASVLPAVNKWYLIVGVMQAESGTIDSGISGLYDCETGQRVSAGKDYKIKAGAVRQYLRAYLYYSNNTNAKQYFWAPRVDVIDGNEPSLTSMMPMVAVNALSNANAAQAYATAKYNEVVSTITTKDNAQTSRVTTMEASLKTDAQNRANKALTDAKAYSDANDVKATALTTAKYNEAVNLVNTKDSAMGTRVTSLTSSMNSATASVKTLATAVNGLKAEYTIKVNASGHVAGIGLSSGAMGSAFIAQADRIVLANSAGGGGVAPFKLVSNVVYLNEAVIQNASISGAKIKNASITNAQIANGTITNAQIANATISFAKIANDIRSTNYVVGVSGWQLTKEGALNATNANISGTITGSKISGSFLEGTVVFGESGFLTATSADKGSGIRYGGQESYYVTRSTRSVLTNPTMTFRIASYNFIGDGYDTINTNPPTQIARDYKRCISNNFSGLGWIDVEAAGVGNLNMNAGTNNTIKIWMEVATYDHKLVRKTLPNITVYDAIVSHGSVPKAFSVQRAGCVGQLYYEPAVVNGRNTIKTLYLTIDKFYSQPYSLQKYFTLTVFCSVNGISVPYSSTITVRADDFQFYSS
ncbi:phage tail tip fiber protein [Shewanella baltica]|uniref:phage tail tip fiber protein n=1 Tax=Shewanella baltica TaxID=62322 RepID=UPI003D7B3B6B